MRPFFFIVFVSAVILVFGLIEVLLLRTLNVDWWRRRWIRWSAWSLPVLGVGFFVLFAVAEYHNIGWLATLGSVVSATTVILELALMLSLPISGVFNLTSRIIDGFRKSAPADSPVDRRRRFFLKGAAAAAPAMAVAMGMSGVGRALGTANVEKKTFEFANLPAALDGLRILHLSDLHLGHYVGLSDLEAVLDEASGFNPDLVLFTGDIADDLTQLPDTLRMIEHLQAPLGAFASLGNHEYFRGVTTVKNVFASSDMHLLVNEGAGVDVAGNTLYLAGIDDPVRMRGVTGAFFERAIEQALRARLTDTFTLLMSHRPDAFPYAARQGIDLTLAGHTHGAQIGFMDRSILETNFPDKFLWGKYQSGNSHLYTSCGTGHWFPFRLGCPQEAPIIELKRA